MLALVLPGEASPLPHIGPARGPGGLGDALLEGVAGAGLVHIRRCRFIQQPTQVEKVLLAARALGERGALPLAPESYRHCSAGPMVVPIRW